MFLSGLSHTSGQVASEVCEEFSFTPLIEREHLSSLFIMYQCCSPNHSKQPWSQAPCKALRQNGSQMSLKSILKVMDRGASSSTPIPAVVGAVELEKKGPNSCPLPSQCLPPAPSGPDTCFPLKQKRGVVSSCQTPPLSKHIFPSKVTFRWRGAEAACSYLGRGPACPAKSSSLPASPRTLKNAPSKQSKNHATFS